MKKWDLVAIGEVLMDMSPLKFGDQLAFVANPGGAPCNVAVMAAKMGSRSAFIGKVGNDGFGAQLVATLKAEGVDTRGVALSESEPTTLAFVHLDQNGERSFRFYRQQTADLQLTLQDLPLEMLADSRTVCFGSVALAANPLRDTVLAALSHAKSAGSVVVFDPNYRPLLWPDAATALEWMRRGLRWADILKTSEEEALLLADAGTLEDAMAYFISSGIPLVCITLGPRGAMVGYSGTVAVCEACPVDHVVDTTGAGDAFLGALIAELVRTRVIAETELQGRWQCRINEDMQATVMACVQRANTAAGLCIQKIGAVPAMPDKKAVLEADL